MNHFLGLMTLALFATSWASSWSYSLSSPPCPSCASSLLIFLSSFSGNIFVASVLHSSLVWHIPECVETVVSTFTYLGSIVDENMVGLMLISSLALKREGPPLRHWNLCGDHLLCISLKTKIRLLNSNIKTVLLYGSECWKISKEITRKLRVFVHKCLGIILRISWSNISNKYVYKGEMQPRRHHGWTCQKTL